MTSFDPDRAKLNLYFKLNRQIDHWRDNFLTLFIRKSEANDAMKNPKILERFESKLHEANCPIIRSQDQNCHDNHFLLF